MPVRDILKPATNGKHATLPNLLSSPSLLLGSLLRTSQGVDNSLQRGAVRTPHPINQPLAGEAHRLPGLQAGDLDTLGLAVAEEDEGGHSGDVVRLGDGVDVVDVDLCESQTALSGVLVGPLGEDGRDGAAGRTPVGVEVDDDVLGRGEERVQLGLAGELVDLAGCLGDGRAVGKEHLDGTLAGIRVRLVAGAVRGLRQVVGTLRRLGGSHLRVR